MTAVILRYRSSGNSKLVRLSLGPLMNGRKMDKRQREIAVREGRAKGGLAWLYPQHLAADASFTPMPIKPRNFGRIGGRKNRRLATEVSDPLPKLG